MSSNLIKYNMKIPTNFETDWQVIWFIHNLHTQNWWRKVSNIKLLWVQLSVSLFDVLHQSRPGFSALILKGKINTQDKEFLYQLYKRNLILSKISISSNEPVLKKLRKNIILSKSYKGILIDICYNNIVCFKVEMHIA